MAYFHGLYMELIIRQKMLQWMHQRFEVVDDKENMIYKVNPAGFLKRHEIVDFSGNCVGIVKKRYFRVFARNDVLNLNRELQYIIKRKFSIFTKRFKIIDKTAEKANYILSGNILAWNFELKKNDVVVAEYSKKLIALTDTFKINVLDESVKILAVAIAVTLDTVFRDKRRRGIFHIGN